MALGIYQDLDICIPYKDKLIKCLFALQRSSGAFANDISTEAGSTPATAAALCILYYLNHDIPDKTINWLKVQTHTQGGFTAVPMISPAIIPDLLSTATALHALTLIGVDIEPIREPCLDFLDSLWDPQGGFHGTWADETLDCEYTYYGLLALGHLYRE